MGLFDRRQLSDADVQALARAIVEESERRSSAKKQPERKKTKYITRQCKYCGYRVTYLANNTPPGVVCAKRGSGKPHIWQTLGYTYK